MYELYGWRGKIGLLLPSLNTTTEFEFNRMAPVGVSFHASRLKYKIEEINSIQRTIRLTEEEVPKAAEEIAQASVDIIAYCCTSGSFIKGVGYDKKIIKRIENITGIPATTTITAVVEALKELEVKKVAMVTPYSEEISKIGEKFLSDTGFKVVDIVCGRLDPMPSFVAYKRAKKVDVRDADGVFISCTGFQTMGILNDLENDLGKPVVSANQATMWYILKQLRIRDIITEYGSLLKRPR